MGSDRVTLASRLSGTGSQGQDRPLSSSEREAEVLKQRQKYDSAAFWLLGLLNNTAYVIMLAGANEISSGAVGLTYLCGILPSLVVKATGPYWFHYFSYRTRTWMIALLMLGSYTTVALSDGLSPRLLGVALSSFQGGLGESSCLAMASFYDSRRVITFWSSGTGFAGVLGYTWVAGLHLLLGVSFRDTLLLANVSTVAWLAVYHLLLQAPEKKVGAKRVLTSSAGGSARQPEGSGSVVELASDVPRDVLPEEQVYPLLEGQGPSSSGDSRSEDALKASRMQQMSWQERGRRTLALWPYIAPLTLVYFAEYSMQAGTWTAIGFPVNVKEKRAAFYSAANWTYQLGVFISRSSGMVVQANLRWLWIMPAMQVGFLVFFTFDAWLHFWYNYWLLVPCLMTGLLGGAVYVNAFTLISKDIEPKYREFSLSAASLGDSLGIALADVTGIFIQGCLYRLNNLPDATFTC